MVDHLTLAQFIEGVSGWHPPSLEMPVRPIIDSRDAEEGTVFLAFKGERVDGHDYVVDAFSRGAVAAVIDREVDAGTGAVLDLTTDIDQTASLSTPLLIRVPDVLDALQKAARWWRRRLSVRVIGITGSVGKTTTKELVAQVLGVRYDVMRSQGSYNNEIGLPVTLLRLTGAQERLVLELGMYVRGDIHFLSNIAQPDVGIVTNVEPVHAERAGSIEEIALGKRELVEALPPAPEGVAILNYDDLRVRAMAEHTQARAFFYGLTSKADLWADEVVSLGLEGIRAVLHEGGRSIPVVAPLMGRHSIYPVLRATAAGRVEGLEWSEIVEGLQRLDVPPRLVSVEGIHGSLILDDTYNSSPPSALAALDLLEDLEGRKIAVLGDMLELGAYAEAGHLEVGRRAAEVVSELVVVGDLGPLIRRGAMDRGLTEDHIHVVPNSAMAGGFLRSMVEPGDVILVKGSRGVKMERIVNALAADREAAPDA